MVESYGDSISMAPARGCWRLAHVQTSGGMATLVRSDQQADTQQLILDYVADNSCDVVGLGDTRLGDDPSELTRMARGIQARVAREREEATSTGAVDGNEGRDKGNIRTGNRLRLRRLQRRGVAARCRAPNGLRPPLR